MVPAAATIETAAAIMPGMVATGIVMTAGIVMAAIAGMMVSVMTVMVMVGAAVITAAKHPPGHIAATGITPPTFRGTHLRKKHEEANQHESEDHEFHWDSGDTKKSIQPRRAGKGEVFILTERLLRSISRQVPAPITAADLTLAPYRSISLEISEKVRTLNLASVPIHESFWTFVADYSLPRTSSYPTSTKTRTLGGTSTRGTASILGV
jgi:hypothetical protein